jgi:hypothetical protein
MVAIWQVDPHPRCILKYFTERLTDRLIVTQQRPLIFRRYPMNERSVIVSEEVDVYKAEPVSPWFTFVIACLLVAIFSALLIAVF